KLFSGRPLDSWNHCPSSFRSRHVPQVDELVFVRRFKDYSPSFAIPVPVWLNRLPQLQLAESSTQPSFSPQSHTQPVILAGAPTANPLSGTSFVTTAPAPMRAYRPIVIPQMIVQLAPSVAPFFTSVGFNSPIRGISLRGLNTFVNTIEGPQ